MLNSPKEKTSASYRTVTVTREPEAQLTVKLETVTPARAQEWLENNDPNNRQISKSSVKKYSSDIGAGRWDVTGESIKFDTNGMLLDGQHRLLACLDADKPFDVLIVRGLPTDAKTHMDLGMKRTAAMVFHTMGKKNTVQLGGAIQALLEIKAAGRDNRGRHSVPEMVTVLERHPDLTEAVAEIFAKGKGAVGPGPSILSAVYYCAAYLLGEREKADAFLEVFRTGVPAYTGDPAHLWRERLIREKRAGVKQSRAQMLRGTCHAWNLFKNEVSQSKIRVPDDLHIEGLNLNRI